MLRHVAMGYSVHLLRVLGPLTFGFCPALIPGYTDHSPEGIRLRSLVFESCEICHIRFAISLPPYDILYLLSEIEESIVFARLHYTGGVLFAF